MNLVPAVSREYRKSETLGDLLQYKHYSMHNSRAKIEDADPFPPPEDNALHRALFHHSTNLCSVHSEVDREARENMPSYTYTRKALYNIVALLFCTVNK
jgi:hypothetical protein